MRGTEYSLMYTMFGGLILTAVFVLSALYLMGGLAESSVNVQMDIARVEEIDIVNSAEACLKGTDDHIPATRLDELKSSGNLKDFCDLPVPLGLTVEDVVSEEMESDGKWRIDYDKYRKKSDFILTTVKVGEEVHVSRLQVSFEA